MLEANTDRMWFTIGAILIGAALVMLGENSLPGVLEKTIGQMDGFAKEAEDATIDFDTGIVYTPKVNTGQSVLMSNWFSQASNGLTDISTVGYRSFKLEVRNGQLGGPGRNTGGIRLTPGVASFKPHTKYVLKFQYQKTSGKLLSFGGHVDSPFIRANMKVYVDGKLNADDFKLAQSAYKQDDMAKHSVEVHFTTGDASESVVTNVYGMWIQPNRERQEDVSVNMYNLSLAEVID